MTSKQRAYLKSLAMKIDPIYNIGKGSISPELVQGVRDALEARELIKVGVLQSPFPVYLFLYQLYLNVYYISIYAHFSFYANSAIYSAKVSFESPK